MAKDLDGSSVLTHESQALYFRISAHQALLRSRESLPRTLRQVLVQTLFCWRAEWMVFQQSAHA